jgi:hypothetical protein
MHKHIFLKNWKDDFYLEQNGIIIDKFCPNCKKILLEDKNFCNCGFFLKAEKNSVYWSSTLPVLLITVLLIFSGLITLPKFKDYAKTKYKKHSQSINALSPINIQVITSLKNSSYVDYIQNVYVKPKQENKLVILIKPMSWNFLSKDEKKEILKNVKENWDVIYKENHPESKLKTQVSFANP